MVDNTIELYDPLSDFDIAVYLFLLWLGSLLAEADAADETKAEKKGGEDEGDDVELSDTEEDEWGKKKRARKRTSSVKSAASPRKLDASAAPDRETRYQHRYASPSKIQGESSLRGPLRYL